MWTLRNSKVLKQKQKSAEWRITDAFEDESNHMRCVRGNRGLSECRSDAGAVDLAVVFAGKLRNGIDHLYCGIVDHSGR